MLKKTAEKRKHDKKLFIEPLLSRRGSWDWSHRRIGLIATGPSDCMIE
jgi:hypothetical protein